MSLLKEECYTPSTQRGVLYFNTVPRDMRPQEVRLHFNQYGDIRRMKFIPFPKKTRRPGGALLPLQYKEGWMEFTSAEDARYAAACRNGQPVDVKRQRRCYGQLWTVRFMEDFTWDSLLEEAEGKRRARRAAEVEAQREERAMNEAYRRMVLQAQQQRRRGKRSQQPLHAQNGNATAVSLVTPSTTVHASKRTSTLAAKKAGVKAVKKAKKVSRA
jgi:ESF2/ABP1 family protein